MAKTADLGHDDDSAKDVGRQLRHVRRKQGLSRSEVARSAGLTRRELAAYERGKQSVPESDLWCLAGSCGVDVGDLLPERAPVQVTSDLSLLAVGDSIRYLRSPVEDNELLRQYLAMIYELRNVPPGSTVPLRERDLVALADVLGGSPERIESRLVELIGMSGEEAARLRAMILPPLSLGAGIAGDADGTAAPTGRSTSDLFSALSTPDTAPPRDHDQAVADFFAAPRAPDPFDAPPPPEWVPEPPDEPTAAPASESAVAYDAHASMTDTIDPFAAPPSSGPAMQEPPLEASSMAAPPPATPPIFAPPPVPEAATSWPPEGFVVETPLSAETDLSFPPLPPPLPEPAFAWDAATADDAVVTDAPVTDSPVRDAWAVDAPADPDLPAAPAAYAGPDPAPVTEPIPIPPVSAAPVMQPSDPFLAAPAHEVVVPIPPAFDAFAPPPEPVAIETLLEPALEPVPEPVGDSIDEPVGDSIDEPIDASFPEPGVDLPPESAPDIDAITPLSIVDPFGDEDASHHEITQDENSQDEITWSADTAQMTAPSPAESAPEFERANSQWRVGGIFPATATSDDGALALRRADARWALANLRATADFTIEADVDFSAGAGFGVLFRASVDATERVTGYSFDIDPIAGGGGYLVRQWIDNRQHWRPIANSPVTDPAMLYGRHTISLTMRADQLTALVDGDPVLTIPALSRSSIEVGREPCRGDCIGIQAWATTEVTIDSFRVARY